MAIYQNPHVNNLAWAISSPPLLLPVDSECRWYSNEWYRQAAVESAGLFRQSDQDPAALETSLAERSDRRLGSYFETLWAYWLDMNPRFELLGHNLQINDQGRTLGELDFIVRDRAVGKCLHWELALKFYLGRGDTGLPQNWLGPGKKDRLDIKVDHLMKRQSRYASHKRVREWCEDRGIRIDASAVILKGRLFYPLGTDGPAVFPQHANPQQLRSFWLTPAQFVRRYASEQGFTPLIRGGWMADVPVSHGQAVYRADQLCELLESGELRLPLYVCLVNGDESGDRLFLVDEDWAAE